MTTIVISVVIGGNEKLILPCLDSIYKTYKGPKEIFVTSNLSSKQVLERIKIQFPEVTIILNERKKGFAENHNNVIKISKSKYILILNDDTIIKDGALDNLIKFMDNTPEAGCASPKLLNPDGSLQRVTYSFPTLFRVFLIFSGFRNFISFNKFTLYLAKKISKRKGSSRFWDHSETCRVDTFKGACEIVRRSAIEVVGLMDEVTQYYGEDTEWHYRFKKNGWNVYFFPYAQVIHYGSQTLNSGEHPVSKIIEQTKSVLSIFKKHHSRFQLFLLRAMIISVLCSRIFIEYLKILLGIAGNKSKLYSLNQAMKNAITMNFIR